MDFLKPFLLKLGYCSKPQFIIIGTQKGGTSGLFNILNQHSLLYGSSQKEVHYFDNDEWYEQNKLEEYHSYFPLPHQIPKGAKVFEASPLYLFHPKAAERLYSYNPKLKLIILLRNPVERAFSAWTMYHHHFSNQLSSRHDPRSFSQAIHYELNHLQTSDYYSDFRSYLKRGIYVNQIQNFLKFFPRKQLLAIESASLKNDFDPTIREILNFIGIPYAKLENITSNKSQINDKNQYQKEVKALHQFFEPFNKQLFDLLDTNWNWDYKT